MNYVANPVEVTAYVINGVSLLDDGGAVVALVGADSYKCSAEMLARYSPVNGDYLVIQADGYTYLNPKDVFERKYRAIKAEGLSFGDAVAAIKDGKRAARSGWNGKGMWLCYGAGHDGLEAEKFWNPHTRAFAEQNGGKAPVLPYIIMKTASGEVLMGWLASQSDMLAEDWVILD